MALEIPGGLAPLVPAPAALERLVYLVGPARGGTSIMNYAMNAHPRALVLPVTHFTQTVWRYRYKVHDRLLMNILTIPKFWDTEALKRLGPEIYTLHRHMVNKALAGRDLADMYKLYPITSSLTGASGKDPKDIACWHDKQNDWRYMNDIARAFPQSKFIFVARDPRSVALSGGVRLAKKAGIDTKTPNRTDLVNTALYWRFLLQRCLDFVGRHPGRALVVRFEDFMQSPVVTMNRIFSFTQGEPMDEDALDKALSTLIGNATNDRSTIYYGVSKEPLDRWKTALNRDEIAVVESLTAPTARKLGYDIDRKDGLRAALSGLSGLSGRGSQIRAGLKTLVSEAYEMQLRPIP